MEILNFSSNIKSLSAKYIDDNNIDVIGSALRLEQDFTVYDSEIFNSINDVKTGGYSTLFLTKQKYGEELLKYKNPITYKDNIVVTDIRFSDSNEPLFWHIDMPKDISDLNTTCRLLPEKSIKNKNNIYFEIELIDERYCRISHRVNNNIFYLTTNSFLEVYLSNLKQTQSPTLTAIDSFVFSYIIDKADDKISFYKSASGFNYSVTVGEQKQLTLNKITSAAYVPFDSSNTFYIKYNDKISNISPKLNTSWISYKDIDSLEINTKKSAFKNRNNYLISTQYSYITGNDLEINILPLKNQLTKSGISQRGDYLLNIPNKLYPQSSLRDYHKIHIGNRQESNNNEIALTYTFYNTEYIFRPDEYTVFKAPDSLYPYKQLNINDTLFAINGAIGGDSPHSSDRVYTQANKGSYPNIGTYLCTWLSGGSENTPGQWVDRYFNVGKISPIEALTATALKLYDFTSHIEEKINSNIYANDPFFDVRSDLTIEPSKEYIYQRIGNNYIRTFLSHLGDVTIFDALTSRTLRGNVKMPIEGIDRYSFDNMYHSSFIATDVSSFTFSFWLEANWKTPFGYQLAGNFNNKGFGIFNDELITPFIIIPQYNSLFIYNTDFVLINRINFEEGRIKNIIRINPLDDIYVTVEVQEAPKGPINDSLLEIPLESEVRIFKLKSNGTLFDIDVVSEIPSYINFCNTETNIYFLINTSGDVAVYNILEETVEIVKVSIPAELGINFDIKSIGIDRNGRPVGFRGEKCIKTSNNRHAFLLLNKVLAVEDDDHTTRNILLSSSSIIYDFAIDQDDNIFVLHNNFLSKFNKDRELIFKTIIDKNVTNIAIDIVREYTDQGAEQYPIVLSSNDKKQLFLSKINDSGIISKVLLTGPEGAFTGSCDFGVIFNYYNLTNFSLFTKNNMSLANNLRFRLELPNRFYNRDKLQDIIDFNISNLTIGKHHFAYRLDTVRGIISLFVDGAKIQERFFDPAEYSLENTLYNMFNVGAGTYFNGALINNYIKQNDRYFCQNIILEQPRLYSKALDDVDIKFLILNNLKIGEFAVSLPCGERNQVEQLQRLYKWQLPGNKSNYINVRVKGDFISNSEIDTVLKQIIKRDIQSSLPGSVNINEITFEKY